MNKRLSPFVRLAAAGFTLAALMSTGTALAAKTSEAQQRYQQDRAKCMRGETNQDRATCLKEAGAALQDASNTARDEAGERQLARNRTKRCRTLPAAERQECVARMNDGTTSGSAQQGGILRERTSTVK